ncbi:MAG TPA: DmsE family decaheme c-type cytochrome [Usitatibacter sp.]|nr:DmsE family decaheme c-type cytochrome [Usitatibacter sp.]
MKTARLWVHAALCSLVAALGISAGDALAQAPGPEVCKNCHEDQVNAFDATIHGKKAHPRSPASAQGCASCHGDGTAHVKAGGGRGVGGMINLSSKSIPADQRDATCLNCHGANRHLAFWDAGKHRKNDVSCSDCHSVHKGAGSQLKLKGAQIAPMTTSSRVPQQEVCFNCHRDIKAMVMRPSHHPIVEGKIQCTSCHNPHGALTAAMVNAESVKELCTSCHADKRGPFMFEHAPVEESCLNCHNPHGTRAAKLLNEKLPNLCQDCHDAAQHPGTIYDADAGFGSGVGATSGPNTRFLARSCMNCHNTIHGSNAPAARGRRFVR